MVKERCVGGEKCVSSEGGVSVVKERCVSGEKEVCRWGGKVCQW